jgi:probable rRNA maturation factor
MSAPILQISHRAPGTRYDAAEFERLARAAFPLCCQLASEGGFPLAHLEECSVSVLGRRAMAKVHRDFLGIPGATDVITFPYGEILVCAPVASERAAEFSLTTTVELALYAIHGFLHLSGFDDLEAADAERMRLQQEALLRTVCST